MAAFGGGSAIQASLFPGQHLHWPTQQFITASCSLYVVCPSQALHVEANVIRTPN